MSALVHRPRCVLARGGLGACSRRRHRAGRHHVSDRRVHGLRLGELLALRWRDVDFVGQAIRVHRSYTTHGGLSTPKSGKVRAVPMVPDVASALARLGQRPLFTGEDDLIFCGATGDFADASALRDRYKAAQKAARLRPLRFHDLRHTFGTLAVRKAELTAVQAWMGHSHIGTTMRYIHHRDRGDEARLLAEAFEVRPPPELSVPASP